MILREALKNLKFNPNMEEFIDFCIRNERYIVREHKKEVI